MRCPFCNQDNTRVVDSRPVEESNAIRRRRMCDGCGRRFTTYEKVETIPLIVIKKDQNREQYDRSIDYPAACCGPAISGRCPYRRSTNWWIRWRWKFLTGKRRRSPVSVIGELVMNRLKDLDPVAYVRFASVYREFKDVNTFMDELKKFLQ